MTPAVPVGPPLEPEEPVLSFPEPEVQAVKNAKQSNDKLMRATEWR
jgi:hypothetical protein